MVVSTVTGRPATRSSAQAQNASGSGGRSGSKNTAAPCVSKRTEPTSCSQSAALPGVAPGTQSGCGAVQRQRPGAIGFTGGAYRRECPVAAPALRGRGP